MASDDVIRELRLQLNEKDEQLVMAGQLGKQLLDRNSELNEEMEQRSKEHATEIEVFLFSILLFCVLRAYLMLNIFLQVNFFSQ